MRNDDLPQRGIPRSPVLIGQRNACREFRAIFRQMMIIRVLKSRAEPFRQERPDERFPGTADAHDNEGGVMTVTGCVH